MCQYVYFLIDFLNINSETINKFESIKVPKTLIISKLDIIPKSIKDNTIINWLKEEYSITEEIIFHHGRHQTYWLLQLELLRQVAR